MKHRSTSFLAVTAVLAVMVSTTCNSLAAADLVYAKDGSGEWQSFDIVFTAPVFEGDKLAKADAAMTQSVRSVWRWRIVYLRALIDKELFERKGKLEGGTLKSAFEELTRIYHAENAHSMPIKPPQIK